MRFAISFLLFSIHCFSAGAQPVSVIDSVVVYGDIKITIDKPTPSIKGKPVVLIFYALPNGNTTGMTMGKRMQPGDDWHFDIQHIKAQTRFIRRQDTTAAYFVFYLENSLRSWPAWKRKHTSYSTVFPRLIDSFYHSVPAKHKSVYLNGHSGGGSFIFGFVDGIKKIPKYIKRISFLDSDYGYEKKYDPFFFKWLCKVKGASLNVFAYNDSVALYNGKRIVSDTGGTWVKSHWWLSQLRTKFSFTKLITDSILIYKSQNKRIQFFFKPNYNQGIYHTQQVELNGFIHSVFCGTRFDSKGYQYYGNRAYPELIE